MSTDPKTGDTKPAPNSGSDQTPDTPAASPEAPASAAGAAATGHSAEAAEWAAGFPPPPKHHDDLIAELRRKLSDIEDKNLRLLADMENLRRRTEDEKSNAAKYAINRFAGDIINVGDNFQRAMKAVPAGAAEADPALKSLADGVGMIEREYLNVLERHGVKRVAALGEICNPHFHQAMAQIPKPDVPAGTILQVFQDGYTIGDRLLRAAVVTVAEGGPKPGAKPPEAPAADASPAPAADAKPETPSSS